MMTYRQDFYERTTGDRHQVEIMFSFPGERRYTLTIDGDEIGAYPTEWRALDRVAEILRETGWSPTPTK